jgi:hypothetical protein
MGLRPYSDGKLSELAVEIAVRDVVRSKANELRKALASLGDRLSEGDDSELIIWVIYRVLACAHRPLRHHLKFGGSRRDLPPEAQAAIFQWVERIKGYGIRGIISLMHPNEMNHYSQVDLGASDLIESYRKEGFKVHHIPWEDPAHRPSSGRYNFQDELLRIREEALEAFDELPKPVLLHCSAGIDRSSPVAAYIFSLRANKNEVDG